MDALNSVPTVPKRLPKRKPVNKPKTTPAGSNLKDNASPSHNNFVSGEGMLFIRQMDCALYLYIDLFSW